MKDTTNKCSPLEDVVSYFEATKSTPYRKVLIPFLRGRRSWDRTSEAHRPVAGRKLGSPTFASCARRDVVKAESELG